MATKTKTKTEDYVAPSGMLRYPKTFVVIPRAVMEQWCTVPWADLLLAATLGTDGLSVTNERPYIWGNNCKENPPKTPDVAYMAEGQNSWVGRTVLYQQNW